MSDRECNYCLWKRMKREPRYKGARLTSDPLVDKKTGRVVFGSGVRVKLKDGSDGGPRDAEPLEHGRSAASDQRDPTRQRLGVLVCTAAVSC